MNTSTCIYHYSNQEFHGFLAQKHSNQPKPAVLVVHDWSGRNEFACKKAEQLAEMGYIGFAVDMYGEARTAEEVSEKQALMNPLITDRNLLRARINAAFEAVSQRPEVDKNRIAVIGFCFGGLCALDLARSGALLSGVVSFHGILMKPDDLPNKTIHSKILILHGYEDPMVTSEQVDGFCEEMTQANVDWQVHLYSGTKHGFTNPKAHNHQLGTVYHAQSAHRSWRAMTDFLQEIFE